MPTASGKSADVETLGVTTEEISAAEILERLDSLASTQQPDAPDDGARTAKEWGSLWGIDRQKAGRRVKAGLASGLMKAVTRRRPTLNGQSRSTTCYLWVGESATE